LKKDLAESLKNGTIVSECTRCKAMLETIEDGMNHEDEMLVSFDASADTVSDSQNFKKKLHAI
jgi:prefoldin subunit 5